MQTSKLSAIEASSPLHEKVYQSIVQALMSGHFEPGQKLTYRKIAQQLGVSAMPVRTAFQRLQALGALSPLPNGSVEVPLLSADAFAGLMDTRILVEGMATELAVSRLNGNSLRTVRHHCSERSIAAKKGDINRYLQANFDLKFSIYRHCGNDHLIFIIEILWLQAGPFLRNFAAANPSRVSQILDVDSHEKIVAALEAKDGVRAREATALDIRLAADYLLANASFRNV